MTAASSNRSTLLRSACSATPRRRSSDATSACWRRSRAGATRRLHRDVSQNWGTENRRDRARSRRTAQGRDDRPPATRGERDARRWPPPLRRDGALTAERKRAEREIRALNADLERRVLERTAELQAARRLAIESTMEWRRGRVEEQQRRRWMPRISACGPGRSPAIASSGRRGSTICWESHPLSRSRTRPFLLRFTRMTASASIASWRGRSPATATIGPSIASSGPTAVCTGSATPWAAPPMTSAEKRGT